MLLVERSKVTKDLLKATEKKTTGKVVQGYAKQQKLLFQPLLRPGWSSPDTQGTPKEGSFNMVQHSRPTVLNKAEMPLL